MISTIAEIMNSKWSVRLRTERAELNGQLLLPSAPRGIVLFAHAGSSHSCWRQSRIIAEAFKKSSLAGLLANLLTLEEEAVDIRARNYRFNIPLLTKRLFGITEWIRKNEVTRNLKLGCFGHGTSSSAAIVAAARPGSGISSLISSAGRPDLAGEGLARIRVPALFMVGENDFPLIDINRDAVRHILSVKELVLVPGAGRSPHKGPALALMARWSLEWFERHMRLKEPRPRHSAGANVMVGAFADEVR